LNIRQKVLKDVRQWIKGIKCRGKYYLTGPNNQNLSIEAGSSAKLDDMEQALKKRAFPSEAIVVVLVR
jgi:hypothetical protein